MAKIQCPFMITILSKSEKYRLHGWLEKHDHNIFFCSFHQEVDSIFLPLKLGLPNDLLWPTECKWKLPCVISKSMASTSSNWKPWAALQRSQPLLLYTSARGRVLEEVKTMIRERPQYSAISAAVHYPGSCPYCSQSAILHRLS